MLPTLSLVWVSTMGQRVYAGSETTPPLPSPQTRLAAITFWSLKFREPHLQHKASVQISRLRRTTRARMGNITRICLLCSGLTSKQGVDFSRPVGSGRDLRPLGAPSRRHCLWLGSPWVGEWQGDGCMGWAGLPAQRVRVFAEGRPEGAFWGLPSCSSG